MNHYINCLNVTKVMSEISIIVALILLNGILAMSEIALISARKSSLSNEVKRGSKAAKIALKLANEPDRFLSTIQVGITIIGILTGIYSGSVLADIFAESLVEWGVATSLSHPLAQSVIVILVTYFTLIFGELVPKRIGMSAAERTAKLVARPMYILSRVVSPFVWLLSKSTSFVFNMLRLKSDSGKVTEEEIKSMIQEGAKDGEVQEVEQDIVERVFLLGDLKVSSLMTHRSDVVALDVNMTNMQIREVLEEKLYQIYPVIDRNFDNVRGMVTLKELIFQLDREDFDLGEVISDPIYFHENMSVYKALEQIKEQRLGQALICDEFGSCQGIITLKDILEGLVGTIEDIYSEPDIIKQKEGDGWFVDGQCALHDFLSYFKKEELYSNENNFNTVGGLILEQLEHIPQSGESIEWCGFRFEIVDMDGARIDKILISYHTSNSR